MTDPKFIQCNSSSDSEVRFLHQPTRHYIPNVFLQPNVQNKDKFSVKIILAYYLYFSFFFLLCCVASAVARFSSSDSFISNHSQPLERGTTIDCRKLNGTRAAALCRNRHDRLDILCDSTLKVVQPRLIGNIWIPRRLDEIQQRTVFPTESFRYEQLCRHFRMSFRKPSQVSSPSWHCAIFTLSIHEMRRACSCCASPQPITPAMSSIEMNWEENKVNEYV